jgi:hypothetical protein
VNRARREKNREQADSLVGNDEGRILAPTDSPMQPQWLITSKLQAPGQKLDQPSVFGEKYMIVKYLKLA